MTRVADEKDLVSLPVESVDFEMEDELIKEKFGAIVVATGYDVMPCAAIGEYGYGKYPDVITGMQFERLASCRQCSHPR